MLDIDIVICAFNEEKVIEQTLHEIFAAKNYFPQIVDKIILVDDGSIDSTKRIVTQNFSATDLIFLTNSKNMGVSYSLLKALDYTTKEYVLFVPGDYTYDRFALKKIIDLAISNYEYNALYLGIRKRNRLKRSFFRELAAFLSRFIFLLFNSKNGLIPNYGLLLLPRKYAKLTPRKIKSYGAGIGILGTCLLFRTNIYVVEIDQVPGSEKRYAKLSLKKIHDVLYSAWVISIKRRHIIKELYE